MDPLNVTASIIAVLQLSSKALGYLNDVKESSGDRAKCAVEASNVHSLLTSLRFRLEESDCSTPWYTAVRAIAVKNGPLDQFKQVLEDLVTRMGGGSKNKLHKAGDALVWKFKKEEVHNIISRMERLKTLVQIALEMDHFKLSQAMKDDTGYIRAQIPMLKSGINSLQNERGRIRCEKLTAWISSTDFPAQQSDIISRRQEGTGQWFLDDHTVAKWLQGPNQTLFCPGIPGAGKTMIAAIIIDHLLKKVQSADVGVAYVYCNYKSQGDQDATSLLAAILKQLIHAKPSSMEPVEDLHKQHNYGQNRPSPNEVYKTLELVLTHFSTVHIVVDALDECRDGDGTRSRFIGQLQDLQGKSDLNLLATSRFIPDIEDKFRKAPNLEIRASNEDVRRFVAGQVYRLPKCVQRDATLQDTVQEKIIEAVDGMFLLARLHVDSLLDKRTKNKVQSTLKTMRKGSQALKKAYDDALERIQGQLPNDSILAVNVLSWITCAQRPLTIAEIRCALAVEEGDVELDPDNMPEIEDLISVCAGLVTIDEGSGIIRLVHYTTQEYFEQIREAWNPSAQIYISTTCLTYLSFDTFKSGSCKDEIDFDKRLKQNVLLNYAAIHWPDHARTVQQDVCNLAMFLLKESHLLSSAVQVSYTAWSKKIKTLQGRDCPKTMVGLHFTAQFGLLHLTHALLSQSGEDKVDVDAKDDWERTPLLLALQQGHEAIVELLLDNGADVNLTNGKYGHALVMASYEGHEGIVKLLLADKRTNVNAQSKYHGDALQVASRLGHIKIMKLLLANGADVNAKSEIRGYALHEASEQGRIPPVELLLDNGANVNAQGGKHDTALQAAIIEGHIEMAKFLLDRGADVNAQGKKHGSALQLASRWCRESIVKLLLNNNADINIQGGKYSTALLSASRWGHESIVKYLLENNADVNMSDGEQGGTALLAASSSGHEAIVKLLLDHNADDHTALEVAIERGHRSIVKLLLKAKRTNRQRRESCPTIRPY